MNYKMPKEQVLTKAQKNISIFKESGFWDTLCLDPFWPKTHKFIVDTLSQESPSTGDEMNARYMAEQYLKVFGARELVDNEE